MLIQQMIGNQRDNLNGMKTANNCMFKVMKMKLRKKLKFHKGNRQGKSNEEKQKYKGKKVENTKQPE